MSMVHYLQLYYSHFTVISHHQKLVNVNAEDLRRRLRVFRPSYFAEGLPKPSETKEIVENTEKMELFLHNLAHFFHFYCYFKH